MLGEKGSFLALQVGSRIDSYMTGARQRVGGERREGYRRLH